MRLRMRAHGARGKQLQRFRRGLFALVGCLILVPVAVVWDITVPAGSAATVSAGTTTTLSVVALAGSTIPTLRATVNGASSGTGTPAGTVTFAIVGSNPIQCDDLTTNMVQMSGGVATCKVTSGLPASGSSEMAQATYSGDGAFTSSDGTVTSNDGTFIPSPPLIVTPPASIPDDCSSDAAPALLSWFSSLPQGSTSKPIVVKFPAQACYVVNETLLVQGASDLTIDGNGSTFVETVSPTNAAPMVELWQDTSVTMENMNIYGNYNGNDVSEGDYGFVFEGDSGVCLTNLQMQNIQGDFLYLSPPYDITNSTDALNTNISVTNSTFTNGGYHGLTVQSVDGLNVSHDTFDGIGTDAMDFEYDDYSTPFNPDGTPYWAAQDNVTISDNTWENWGGSDWFASVQGQDPGVQEQHLTISDNDLESSGPLFEVLGTDPRTTTAQYTDADWNITGNHFAPGYYGEPYRGGISQASQIYDVADLTFNNNTFPLCAWTYESPQPFGDCAAPDYFEMDLNVITGGSIAGNDFLGAEGIVQPQPYNQELTNLVQCSNTYGTGIQDGPCT
jgi:hypothetical protein